jgi:mRNA interferase YafQ
MRTIKFTNRFKRDYKREKSGCHRKTLEAMLMETVNLAESGSQAELKALMKLSEPSFAEWDNVEDGVYDNL